MKTGYKQTEVGVIPEDWEASVIDNLCAAVLDCHHSTPVWTPSGKIVIRNQNIKNGKLDLSQPSFTDETHFAERTRRAVPSFGDLVITREAPMGLVCAIPKGLTCCLGQRMVLLRPNHEFADSGYLLYAILSEAFQRSISVAGGTGSTVSNLRIPVLKGLEIPVPPLPEQRAIAGALSEVDALLGAQEALLAKKRDLKQAAMQQLLTGQKRLPSFTGEWQVKRLGDVAEMGSGGTPTSSVPVYYDGNIPWVSISDMTKGGKFIVTTDRNLTPLGFASCAAQLFPVGTVLYAMYASLGECSIAGISLCSSQAILGIRTRANLSSEFLYYYLSSLKIVVKASGQQGTQSNLNKGIVQNFRLSLPPLPEQTAIAAVLSDMDVEIAALEAQRDKTRTLKQGMMQELLTGRIRLV